VAQRCTRDVLSVKGSATETFLMLTSLRLTVAKDAEKKVDILGQGGGFPVTRFIALATG